VSEAAFFDLDKTVVAKSAVLAFTGKMVKAGLLGRRTMLRAAVGQIYYSLFGANHSTAERIRKAVLTLTKGWQRSEVEDLVENALDEVVAPIVFAEALFLIDDHMKAGRRVIIVSASPEEVVRPLARYIGVDEIIATRAEVDEQDRYTGRIELYAYGESKAKEVRRLADDEGISLEGSFAYSDSITDLPLLEEVGHPHAVNPDKDLRQVAEQRGWPVLEFKRQVTIGERLARPVPIISGAALTTMALTVVLWVMMRRARREQRRS